MKQASHPPSLDTSHHLPFALNNQVGPFGDGSSSE